VLVLITMRGEQVRAIRRAIDRYFAAGTAADGADGFALGRTKTVGLAFFADWTRHYGLLRCSAIRQNTLAETISKVEPSGGCRGSHRERFFKLLYVEPLK
jgi:hypothetical protein